MEPVTTVSSRIVPLLYADVDTDQIIPARFISGTTDEEFAHALFRDRREREKSFVLNLPQMVGRSIMLGGRNFGCGSSREAAVWAMIAGGFRVVIASSFGDIFESNALKNGLLPIRLGDQDYAALVEAVERDESLEAVVDLFETKVILSSADLVLSFRVTPFYRELLLAGKDELSYLLGRNEAIKHYEQGPTMHVVAANRAGVC